jgi:hypothetical protein
MTTKRLALFISLLAGCGGKDAVAPPPATPSSEPAAVVTETPPATETPESPASAGPPLAIENLTVAAKKKGDAVQSLDLTWDVVRSGEVPTGTVLFVHSACKVGYGNKYEDETVSGLDAIANGARRSFKLAAFASIGGLAMEPAWCTFSFAHGPKGTTSENKLTSLCWKKGALSDGPCG